MNQNMNIYFNELNISSNNNNNENVNIINEKKLKTLMIYIDKLIKFRI